VICQSGRASVPVGPGHLLDGECRDAEPQYQDHHRRDRYRRTYTQRTVPDSTQCSEIGQRHPPPTHTQPFNGPLSGTTRVGQYQKGKTNLDFTEARDSEWQWHRLGHMQVCTSLQTDNYTSTPPLSFLQAGCPSCCPTNSIKALKAMVNVT